MILDSHLHVASPWPFGEVPDPAGHGSPDRVLEEMDTAGVAAGLLVAAIFRGGDSNELTLQSAHFHTQRFLAVPSIDSMGSPTYQQPGAAERLATLRQRTGPLRGVANYCRDYAWFDTAEGGRFFGRLAELGLFLSIAVFADGLVPLARVARRHPSVTFLVHHCGRIAARDRPGERLDAPLRDPAVRDSPNLWFKLSGLHHLAPAGAAPPYAGLAWVFRALHDAVGPRRLVWGSDFPVSAVHHSYSAGLDFAREQLAFLAPAECDAILGGNLRRLLSWPAFP